MDGGRHSSSSNAPRWSSNSGSVQPDTAKEPPAPLAGRKVAPNAEEEEEEEEEDDDEEEGEVKGGTEDASSAATLALCATRS
jgi:hypothetical protein